MRSRRIGLIGSGRTGVEHAKALIAAGAEIAWIAVRSQSGLERTRALGLSENIFIWDDTDVACISSCDGIVICVPILETARVLERTLELNVPILVEKPVALDCGRLKHLAEKAAVQNIAVYVAFNRRNYAWVRELRRRQSPILNIRAYLTEDPERFRKAGHPEEVIQNLVLANSSHLWDLVFYLSQESDHRYTQMIGTRANGRMVYSLQGESHSGCVWSIQSIEKSYARWRIECETPEATWIASPLEAAEIRSGNESSELITEPKDHKAGFLCQAEEFLKAVKDPGAAVSLARVHELLVLAEKIADLESQSGSSEVLQRNTTWNDPSLLARCQGVKVKVSEGDLPEVAIHIENETAGKFLANDVEKYAAKVVLNLHGRYCSLRIDGVDVASTKIDAASREKLRSRSRVPVSFHGNSGPLVSFQIVATVEWSAEGSVNGPQVSENITALASASNTMSMQEVAKNYRLAFRKSSLAKENARKRAMGVFPEMDCHRQIREYVEKRGPWEEKTLLDVGSGAGHFFHSIKHLGFHYTGIDYSEDLVAIGTECIGLNAPKHFCLQHRSLESLQDDEHFDVVVATNVLYWQPSWQYPIEMLARSTRSTLILREPFGPRFLQRWMPDVLLDDGSQHLNCYFNVLPKPEVARMLDALGFNVQFLQDERIRERFGGEPERVGGIDFPYCILIAERRTRVAR